MKTLPQIVQDPTQRPAIIEDVVRVVEEELAGKRGITGAALKSGYKVVARLKSGRMMPAAVNLLLDEFAVAMEPMRARWAQSAEGSFGDYLAAHDEEAASALLAITDRRAESSSNRALRGTYRKLRPTAVKHVKEALPATGRMIEKYAGRDAVSRP